MEQKQTAHAIQMETMKLALSSQDTRIASQDTRIASQDATIAVPTSWFLSEQLGLFEKNTFIKFTHSLKKLVNVRPLQYVYLMNGAVYFDGNYKIGIVHLLKGAMH
jgi:hypothetical protein